MTTAVFIITASLIAVSGILHVVAARLTHRLAHKDILNEISTLAEEQAKVWNTIGEIWDAQERIWETLKFDSVSGNIMVKQLNNKIMDLQKHTTSLENLLSTYSNKNPTPQEETKE